MAERNYTTNWDAASQTFTKTFKNGEKLEVNVSAMPEVSKHYLMGYGITQRMNDSHSGEKDLDEIIRISKKTSDDLMNGVIRAARTGGIGVNFELLCQAVANAEPELGGSVEKAKELLSKLLPADDDDEDTEKEKKAKLRAVRNYGPVKAELDKLQGKTLAGILAA